MRGSRCRLRRGLLAADCSGRASGLPVSRTTWRSSTSPTAPSRAPTPRAATRAWTTPAPRCACATKS
eukprot:11452751-Alexandrium_andersonii.AAC.1